jgi:signal transduction histidine kinase
MIIFMEDHRVNTGIVANKAGARFFLAFLALAAFAKVASASPMPNTVLFISSVSSEERAYLMEQGFAAEWQARDPGVAIFNYRFAAFSFSPSKKAFELAAADLDERLRARSLRLIVAQGDPSTDLAVSFRSAYCPNVPIISFEATDQARIKYRDQALLYQYNSHNYAEEMLRFGYRLFPKARRAIIAVNTGSDVTTYPTLVAELQPKYPELRIVVVPNPTWASVEETLRASHKDSFVILLSAGWANAEGRMLLGKELIDSIVSGYGIPVLSFIREFAGSGLVGGVGVAARDYGRAVADLGLSLILDGKEPEPWIASKSLATSFADYQALLRFGVSPGSVPTGTELLNRPVSFWVLYRDYIATGIALLVVAISVLSFFLFLRIRERRLLVKANETLEIKVADRTAELQASNEELAAINANLTLMMRRNEAMQESMLRHAREVTLGRLTAGIAHELNTPLNAIGSANEAVRRVLSDPEGGIAHRILALDEGQALLFRRCAPRALEETTLEAMPNAADSSAIEKRLADLGVGASAEIAEDLRDAGLAACEDAQLLELAQDRSSPVVQVLYRVSVFERSTRIIESAVDRIVGVLRTVREYITGLQSDGHEGSVILRESMERALLLFKNRLPALIRLETEYGDLPPIHGNEATLVRLWTHLIQNAFQAMSSGGLLRISIAREGNFALVVVDDEGEGIPPDIADTIFEPFVTTRPLAEGIGLGLAYCKKIVESMRGTISYSAKDKGTVFAVRIPLDEEA